MPPVGLSAIAVQRSSSLQNYNQSLNFTIDTIKQREKFATYKYKFVYLQRTYNPIDIVPAYTYIGIMTGSVYILLFPAGRRYISKHVIAAENP